MKSEAKAGTKIKSVHSDLVSIKKITKRIKALIKSSKKRLTFIT